MKVGMDGGDEWKERLEEGIDGEINGGRDT